MAGPARSHLGRRSELPENPEAAELDRIDNPHPGAVYVVRLTVPEFTCLCPVTGQPDFAHFVIDYVPGSWLVESKSFKFYMAAFRNHRDFHEATTVGIGHRLARALEPSWIRVCGFWYPRGGIPIDVFWTDGRLPDGTYLPDPGVSPYGGRG